MSDPERLAEPPPYAEGETLVNYAATVIKLQREVDILTQSNRMLQRQRDALSARFRTENGCNCGSRRDCPVHAPLYVEPDDGSALWPYRQAVREAIPGATLSMDIDQEDRKRVTSNWPKRSARWA